MRCPKCSADPRPFLKGKSVVTPCGLVQNEDFSADLKECPMGPWQDGYLACLEDEAGERIAEPETVWEFSILDEV